MIVTGQVVVVKNCSNWTVITGSFGLWWLTIFISETTGTMLTIRATNTFDQLRARSSRLFDDRKFGFSTTKVKQSRIDIFATVLWKNAAQVEATAHKGKYYNDEKNDAKDEKTILKSRWRRRRWWRPWDTISIFASRKIVCKWNLSLEDKDEKIKKWRKPRKLIHQTYRFFSFPALQPWKNGITVI